MTTFKRSDDEFISAGTRCAAWVYRPVDCVNPPVVVMAHGFAAERRFGLPDFAERFAAEGWAVYLFDYRCFGDSDGEPRNEVDPFKHSDDWDAAITRVRQMDGIDKSRIVLWGSSFSGGHVTCAASRHPDIHAIIAQVPYTGPAGGAIKPSLVQGLRMMWHLLLDRIKTAVFGAPHCIPVVGRPGSLAVMNTPESYAGYMALVPGDRTFENKVPARIIGLMGKYDPTGVAHLVHCPALIIAGRDDSLIAVDKVAEMAAKMPKGVFKQLDCNHFAPYRGVMFDKNIALQIEFLREVLQPASA